jgi:hypothetical protein
VKVRTKSITATGESKGLNADLQRVLNAAADRVGTWIGERQALAKHLEGIRETASRLLAELGTENGKGGRKNGRAAAPARRRSKLSAEGRARIVAAQKARWARVRKAKEK